MSIWRQEGLTPYLAPNGDMFPCVTKSNRTLEKRHLLLWCNNHRLAFFFSFSPLFPSEICRHLMRKTNESEDDDKIQRWYGQHFGEKKHFKKKPYIRWMFGYVQSLYSFNEENILAKKISALNYTWSKNVHLMYIEQLGWWPNNDSNQYYGGRLLRPVGVEGWSWGRCCKKKHDKT